MKKKLFNIYALLLVAVFYTACRQDDAQVSPIGKSIDYAGPSKTITQLLDSSGFNIYKAAWKRVNMDSVIAKKTLQAYTLLVPSDEAFAKAGITAGNINTIPVAELDTILLYHSMDTWLSSTALKTMVGNLSMHAFLTRGDFSDFNLNAAYTLYQYYQYLGFHDNKLMVNGKPHPLTALDGIDGTIYVLDEVLKKPEQDMIDYLGNNPDFTFFMEACRINDSIYEDMFLSQGFTDLLTAKQRYKPFTLFAPTNHAFQQAGFKTFDDLRQRALRYPVTYPGYNQDNYYVGTYTSLDSVLKDNCLGYSMDIVPEYAMQLFTNDLTDNPVLTNFVIKAGYIYQSPTQYIRLIFSTAGGTLTVKKASSSLPAVPLSTTNMLFRNGVVHVINDGLFVK